MKISDWFNIKKDGQPTLPGWYDIKYGENARLHDFRRYWDGKKWRVGPTSATIGFGNQSSDFHREYWRGLSEDPIKAL